MYDFLKGLRVVEGAAFIAGPSCALHLAQMGATVIRFDAIGGGPDFRRWPLAPSGDSLYWEGLNKGKKSIALNLGSNEGRALAVAIATAPGPDAGMFVTNYPAEGFLSYERLKAVRSDMICIRIMGWPDGSPGVDYTVNAATGLPLMTGPAGSDVPINHVLPAWDLLGGAYAAFALLTAERNRRLSGVGCEIRVPLSDLAAASLSHMGNVAEVLTTGVDRPRFGNALFGAFGRDFITADGCRVMVVAMTPRQWEGLLKTLGIGDAVEELETRLGVSFAEREDARFIHRDHLFPMFEKAFIARPLAVLAPEFDKNGVTWAQYRSLRQALDKDDKLFVGNPIFQNISNPSGLTYPAAGSAATVLGVPRTGPTCAPRLGEHTDEVLAGILGLGASEIERLHAAGIVAGPRSEV
jgi:2-methylfumaryl-CoA isomerase